MTESVTESVFSKALGRSYKHERFTKNGRSQFLIKFQASTRSLIGCMKYNSGFFQ